MSDRLALARVIWRLIKQSVVAFAADDVLSRGASIAFYTVTSIAPLLVMVIAIAGIAFSNAAAQGALTDQLSGLVGPQSAQLLQTVIQNASGKSSGIIASVLSLVTLLAGASGVFGELNAALNIIWKVKPRGGVVSRFVKARLASLGLVVGFSLLLMASLVVGAVLAAFGPYIDAHFPFGKSFLSALNFLVSFGFGSVLFATIYKILPDAAIRWRDVIVGAVATAFLFEIGKLVVGVYLGSSAIASSYGAAGGLIVLLLWVYYSAQIILLGAEFTKAYADHLGQAAPSPNQPPQTNRRKQPARISGTPPA